MRKDSPTGICSIDRDSEPDFSRWSFAWKCPTPSELSFQAEAGIRDYVRCLEFRRVLFRSQGCRGSVRAACSMSASSAAACATIESPPLEGAVSRPCSPYTYVELPTAASGALRLSETVLERSAVC